MRSFYEIERAKPATAADEDARVRRFLQLAVLVFWGPCTAFDGWRLWIYGEGGGGAVFNLLFRQSLVFLALWFTVAASHGLLRGRRGEKPPKASDRRRLRRRMAMDDVSPAAPRRDNRGA